MQTRGRATGSRAPVRVFQLACAQSSHRVSDADIADFDDERSAAFLRDVGTGRIDAITAALAEFPGIVHAVGPHPFWGGRPQPLHVSIETNRRDVFDLLLAAGADVNGNNALYDHWSPMMLTYDRDRAGMREALLARGARIGVVEALMAGDDEAVRRMLHAGKAVLPPDPNGGSILAFARTPYAIDRLLELGAARDVKDRCRRLRSKR